MNTDTNELMNFSDEEWTSLRNTEFNAFKRLPNNLQTEAQSVLGDQKSVIVKDDNSPIAKWARKVRKNAEEKKKNKL